MCYYTYLHFRQEGLLLAMSERQQQNEPNFFVPSRLSSYYMVVKEQVDNA